MDCVRKKQSGLFAEGRSTGISYLHCRETGSWHIRKNITQLRAVGFVILVTWEVLCALNSDSRTITGHTAAVVGGYFSCSMEVVWGDTNYVDFHGERASIVWQMDRLLPGLPG